MNTKTNRLLKSMLSAIVTFVTTIAVMGAASASLINAYQPQVPKKLQG